jgi:hypothetical protein
MRSPCERRTNAEMYELYIKLDPFHGEWNYEIHPRE